MYAVYDMAAVALTGMNIGKWSRHARVADARTGGRPSVGQAVLRAAVLFAVMPVIQLIALVPLLLVAAPAPSLLVASLAVTPVIVALGLHDRVSKTVVTLAPEPARPAAPTTQAR